jgi:hypothetical protein
VESSAADVLVFNLKYRFCVDAILEDSPRLIPSEPACTGGSGGVSGVCCGMSGPSNIPVTPLVAVPYIAPTGLSSQFSDFVLVASPMLNPFPKFLVIVSFWLPITVAFKLDNVNYILWGELK